MSCNALCPVRKRLMARLNNILLRRLARIDQLSPGSFDQRRDVLSRFLRIVEAHESACNFDKREHAHRRAGIANRKRGAVSLS